MPNASLSAQTVGPQQPAAAEEAPVACAAIMQAAFEHDARQADHASAVAALTAGLGGGPEAVAAAYLHDLAEDATPEGEDPAAFLERLGVPDRVAKIVLVLTRNINGKETYAEFIDRILAHPGPEREAAVTVKRADLLVNRARCLARPGYESLLQRYDKALQKMAQR